LSVQVTINGKTAVKQYDAIDILSQVVAAEMGSSFHTEALKAQAVAAHTYIKYYNNLGKAPSVPISAADDKIINAVKSVRDKLVYYDSKPINAVYHACAAGKTNSAADVWGGAVSYLVSVESKYDHLYSGYQSTKQYSVANFKSIIKEKVGIDLEGSPSEWIKVLTRTSGGYVGNVSIGGEKTFVLNGKSKTITGRDLRENILSFGIKSAKFDYSANKSTVTFTTYGYGHGVGMSQVGANLYAQKEGLSYSKILTHYYKGTTVK
jgi:SpoIID/LytB domain protein